MFSTIMTTSVFQLNFSLTQATQTVIDDDDIDTTRRQLRAERTRNVPAPVFTLSLTDPKWTDRKPYILDWDKGTTNSE